MSRRLISELTDHEQVDQIFLLSDKQLRANRNGNLYLQMRLTDRSGAISAMLWNATERTAAGVDSGDYVKVQGATQVYNGALQMIATHVERIDPARIDESEFFPLGSADLASLVRRLGDLLRGMKSAPLRELAERFLSDAAFMERFTAAPAGIKHHHAYRGGLLEHIVDLMELSQLVAPRYPEIDGDLLLMGAFLHDIGKVDELAYDRQLAYTDAGQLLGHLVMAVEMLADKIRECEAATGQQFPDELALRLKHMILSHHGEYEFGSPKLPMTLEAVVLHLLDHLDAKVRSMAQLIRDDPSSEGNWTAYHANLGRKLYKPSLKSDPR